MKSTKTVLAVAILGFAYAVGAGHPDSLTHRCCGPEPEDFRSYYLSGGGVIIPSVEGESGMIITDVVCVTNTTAAVTTCSLRTAPGEDFVTLRLDAGAGGEWTRSVHFQSGLPVPAGAEIYSSTSNSVKVTISGYVY